MRIMCICDFNMLCHDLGPKIIELHYFSYDWYYYEVVQFEDVNYDTLYQKNSSSHLISSIEKMSKYRQIDIISTIERNSHLTFCSSNLTRCHYVFDFSWIGAFKKMLSMFTLAS